MGQKTKGHSINRSKGLYMCLLMCICIIESVLAKRIGFPSDFKFAREQVQGYNVLQPSKGAQALQTLQRNQQFNAKGLQEPVQHRSSTTHLGSAHGTERDDAFFSTLAVTCCPNPQTIVRDVQLLQSTLEWRLYKRLERGQGTEGD